MSEIILPFEHPLDKAKRIREELRDEGAEQCVRFCKNCKRLAHRPDFWGSLDHLIEQSESLARFDIVERFDQWETLLACDMCRQMTGPLTGEGLMAIYRLSGFDGLVRALRDIYGSTEEN